MRAAWRVPDSPVWGAVRTDPQMGAESRVIHANRIRLSLCLRTPALSFSGRGSTSEDRELLVPFHREQWVC